VTVETLKVRDEISYLAKQFYQTLVNIFQEAILRLCPPNIHVEYSHSVSTHSIFKEDRNCLAI